MVAYNKRLKDITLTIGAIAIECQVTEFHLNPPQNIGDLVYTMCLDGAFREEVDDEDWTLDLTWVTDWRTGSLNRYLFANVGATAAFVLTEHPTTVGSKVQWAGNLLVRAPAVGGAARETEMTQMTFTGVGAYPLPTYPA